MSLLRAVYDAIAIVMIVSGIAKMADPRPFESTWLAIWRRPPRGTGQVVGTSEVILGALALVSAALWTDLAAPIALLVAVAYLSFTGVVLLAIRRGVPSCGCFGRRAAPPGPIHVFTDLASAAVALVVAVDVLRAGDDAPGSWSAVQDIGWTSLLQVVAVGLLAWLIVVIDTDGAALAHEVNRR